MDSETKKMYLLDLRKSGMFQLLAMVFDLSFSKNLELPSICKLLFEYIRT